MNRLFVVAIVFLPLFTWVISIRRSNAPNIYLYAIFIYLLSIVLFLKGPGFGLVPPNLLLLTVVFNLIIYGALWIGHLNVKNNTPSLNSDWKTGVFFVKIKNKEILIVICGNIPALFFLITLLP